MSSPDVQRSSTREKVSGLGPKWVRLAPNGTNLGLFQFASLIHFGAKSDIPARLNRGGENSISARVVINEEKVN